MRLHFQARLYLPRRAAKGAQFQLWTVACDLSDLPGVLSQPGDFGDDVVPSAAPKGLGLL